MRSKNNALEIEIDFTAQQLLAPLGDSAVLEIEDVGELDAPAQTPAHAPAALDETSEIELTPEQIDAMLEGRWP